VNRALPDSGKQRFSFEKPESERKSIARTRLSQARRKNPALTESSSARAIG
jgi:hypothetical protein